MTEKFDFTQERTGPFKAAAEAVKGLEPGSKEANKVFFDHLAQSGGYDDFAAKALPTNKSGKSLHHRLVEKMLRSSSLVQSLDSSESDEEEDGKAEAAAALAVTPNFSTGITFDPSATRVLDYACGTGLLSQALAPHVKEIVGVDLSDGMVAEYNRKVDQQGIDKSEMEAFVGDLLSVEGAKGFEGDRFHFFDVIMIGLAFHHFPHSEAEPLASHIQSLLSRLKYGGHLVIFDFLAYDADATANLPGHHTVTSHGFTETQITKILGDGGAANVGVNKLGKGMSLRFPKSWLSDMHGHDGGHGHAHAHGGHAHAHAHGHGQAQGGIIKKLHGLVAGKGKTAAESDKGEESKEEFFERQIFMAVGMRPFVMIS